MWLLGIKLENMSNASRQIIRKKTNRQIISERRVNSYYEQKYEEVDCM